MLRKTFKLSVLVGLLAASFLYGFFSHRYRTFPYEQVRWALRDARELVRSLRADEATESSTETPAQMNPEELERLHALGYLQGYEEAPEISGVALHDPARVHAGLNFFVSAHAPEAVLMTLDGKPLHTWRRSFRDVCPKEYDSKNFAQAFFRRALPLANGDLIAIYDYEAMVRFNKDSEIVWKNCQRYHHDISLDADGNIYTLRRDRRFIPEVDEWHPILDDRIAVLRPDGSTLREISIYDAFQNSTYASLLSRMERKRVEEFGDVFHTNSVKLLDGRHATTFPAAQKGNLLISIRHLDTIAILDPKSERIVWALSGMWRYQHEPFLLENGNILLFDNLGRAGETQVIEFDPLSQQILWRYAGEPGERFFSRCCGANQRLANGNTLITLSQRGRALEVTPAGDVVWEFQSPYRTGEANELVATLMELVRLEPDFPLDWLQP